MVQLYDVNFCETFPIFLLCANSRKIHSFDKYITDNLLFAAVTSSNDSLVIKFGGKCRKEFFALLNTTVTG